MVPRKCTFKYYSLMSCLSSPLHHGVGLTEAIALYSPVTAFHSFPGHQMETETLCSEVLSAIEIPPFVIPKILGLSLLNSGPIFYNT